MIDPSKTARRLALVAMLGLLVWAPLSACQPGGAPGEATPHAEATEPAAGAATEAAAVPDPEANPEADPEAPTAEPFDPSAADLVVYSGRSENLVGPLIERFEDESGLEVAVRWGDTAELAALLLEEGAVSRADVFFAQEPGALGAVEDLLAPLPATVLDRVAPRFRDPGGRWVGTSGRARVVVYNTASLTPADLPEGMEGFVDPKWTGRIGWAPSNASFQSMVTAMRTAWGEDRTRAWLEGIVANEPVVFDRNAPIVEAVGAGEVDVGFSNHYYLYRFLTEEGPGFPARNHFLTDGGPGSLVLEAGIGIVATGSHREAAEKIAAFLLTPEAQRYFADETFEYPLIDGVAPAAIVDMPPLAELHAIDLDAGDLADARGTLALLRDVGALP